MFLAPFLPGLVILGDGQARGLQLGRVNGLTVLGQGGAVKTGDEKGFYL